MNFSRLLAGKQPNYQYFAKNRETLENANDNLVEGSISDFTSEYYEYKIDDDKHQGATVVLKPNLREAVDYIIVDQDILDFFVSNF